MTTAYDFRLEVDKMTKRDLIRQLACLTNEDGSPVFPELRTACPDSYPSSVPVVDVCQACWDRDLRHSDECERCVNGERWVPISRFYIDDLTEIVNEAGYFMECRRADVGDGYEMRWSVQRHDTTGLRFVHTNPYAAVLLTFRR